MSLRKYVNSQSELGLFTKVFLLSVWLGLLDSLVTEQAVQNLQRKVAFAKKTSGCQTCQGLICYAAFFCLFPFKNTVQTTCYNDEERVVSITTRGHSAQSAYGQHSDSPARHSHNTASCLCSLTLNDQQPPPPSLCPLFIWVDGVLGCLCTLKEYS